MKKERYPRRRTNLEDPLSGEIDMAEVVAFAAAKIPMPTLSHAVARYLHHVVKVTLVCTANLTRGGVQL